MTPELGALITLVCVALWLRFELRRVRLSGMLHVEPVNQSADVERLQGRVLDAEAKYEQAKLAMDALRDELQERRSNGN